MKKIGGLPQIWILIVVFVISRVVVMAMGLHLNIWALSAYWQYLDLDTLQNHLLTGVWYDHTQPPVFNLLLGSILKIGGQNSAFLFGFLLKIISLCNGLLLFHIVRKLTVVEFLPLFVALAYIISPATLVFECELFYTTIISLLLLLSLYYLIRLSGSEKISDGIGVFLPLALLCLTRSVYHIIWLTILTGFLLFYFRKKAIFNKLILVSLTALLLVGSWYVKNKIIFGKLTTSTWIGMNLSRNVFHDNETTDSSKIEAYEAFSKISLYRKFIAPSYEIKFRGLNDRDLLSENKNDSIGNMKEVSYIPVSDLYMKASVEHIKSHPLSYAQNILQSAILYFTPATMYSLAIEQSGKIKYFDLPYSFKLTYFSHSKMQRRILLTISAIPKLLLYLFVFFIFIRYSIQIRSLAPWNLFIVLTIFFVFGISSLLEHYENMRFRFETEPLFLILAAQVVSLLCTRTTSIITKKNASDSGNHARSHP
jgi:hypothetical protein